MRTYPSSGIIVIKISWKKRSNRIVLNNIVVENRKSSNPPTKTWVSSGRSLLLFQYSAIARLLKKSKQVTRAKQFPFHAPRPPGGATASVVVIVCVPAGLVSTSGEVSLHQTSGVLCVVRLPWIAADSS